MNQRTKTWITIGAGILALGVTGAGIAAFADNATEITGSAADQARAAAVQALPGSQAGKVESENEGGTSQYIVEVMKPDGSRTDVHLDSSYHLTGIGTDDDGED